MATKPTPGGSDGTYGTELNAFLDISLADDGKIKDGAVLEAATETADGDRTVADLGYVKTGDTVQYDAVDGFSNCDVDSVKTKVYTVYFTGTLDADSSTSVAHGVTGIDNILHVSVAVFDSGSNVYRVGEILSNANASKTVTFSYDGTNVIMGSIGADIQGQKYRIKVAYIL